MAYKLSPDRLHELSIVTTKGADGREYAPRNTEAVMLAAKAAAEAVSVGPKPEVKKSRIIKLVEKIKSWYTDGPVVNGDGNSEGPETDYNAVVALITVMNYDLQSACWIQDDDGRSAAVTAIVDNFLQQLDELRPSAAADKAGARHSAADKAHIDAVTVAHDKLGKALAAATKAHDAMDEHLDSLGSTSGSSSGEDNGEGDDTADKAKRIAALDAAAKAAADACKADDEKPTGDYGTDEEAGYADKGWQEDGKPRYPTKKDGTVNADRVRSAWSYINKDENASKYSSENLAKVKSNIKAAAKECGVEIDDSKAGLAEEIDMKPEELKAMIADAAKAAATEAATAVKAELQPKIDEANERATKAEADAKTAEDLRLKAEQAANVNARQTVGGASEQPVDAAKAAHVAKVKSAIKAALGANPIPTVI